MWSESIEIFNPYEATVEAVERELNNKIKWYKKSIFYMWWRYYWSNKIVWCKDSECQKYRWHGRINIIWGIYNLYKIGMIKFYKENPEFYT